MPAHPAPDERPSVRRHAPALAAGVSFLFPGFGHFLIGAWARGVIWALGLVVVSAAGGGIFVLVLMAVTAADAYVFAREASPPDPGAKP